MLIPRKMVGLVGTMIGAVVLGAAAAPSQAARADEQEWAGIKQAACRSFGCDDGPRNCFDGEVTLQHPVYGGVSVHLWCYEP